MNLITHNLRPIIFDDIINDFEDGLRAAKKPRLVANK